MEHAAELLASLEELESINQHYDLPVENLRALSKTFDQSKVCTPLIGKFSSGKSALLNTLLDCGVRLLPENIAPETAVPTELEYVETQPSKPVTIYFKSKEPESCSLQDYLEMNLDASGMERVHIQLNVPALAQFPDLQLVDMPGFESGLEVHNRAIDSYLGNSMAYLIAFPADDMVMRGTIGNILKELCLHDMPLAVVITKCDKEDSDEAFAEKKEALRQSMRRYIGDRELSWCQTSSFDGEIESLVRFLREVQTRAQELRVRKFQALLKPEVENTSCYLQSLLNGAALSQSELAVQADKLRTETEEMQRDLVDLAAVFREKIPQCVNAISGDVSQALDNSEAALVTMAVNKQNISEQLNLIVRGAITRGVQQHYLPLVQQYARDVGGVGINTDLDTNVSMDGFNLERNDTVGQIVAGVVAVFISLPGGIALSTFFSHMEKKRREEAVNGIRAELSGRVFPQIMEQVEQRLTSELNAHAQAVAQTIQSQSDARRGDLEKSMADLRLRMAEERQQREQLAEADRANLNRLEEIRNALG